MEQEPGARRTPHRECPEHQAAALPAALVVERLRVEAALLAQGLVMQVAGNMILLPFPGFAAVVIISETGDTGFGVQIHSCLGEALLADEARRILESGRLNVAGQQVTITEDGLVMARWERAFTGAVDVAAVNEALRENLQVAFNVQQALTEDCYLRPVELPEVLAQKGRL